MLRVIYIQDLYADCHYAEFHYAECHYGECHYAECRGAVQGYFKLTNIICMNCFRNTLNSFRKMARVSKIKICTEYLQGAMILSTTTFGITI